MAKLKTNILGILNKFSTMKYVNSLVFLLSSLVFFLITFTRNLSLIKTIGIYVRYKPHYSLPIFGLLILLTLEIKSIEFRRYILFFLITTLFAFSLAGIWASTKSDTYIISGLLPHSDASFQYDGILKLLDYGELNATASRRPISAGLIALLLSVTNRNLQLVLSIFVFVCAVFTWYAVIEVNQLLNKYSAIIFLFVSILFYSKFAGTVMTENLGFILGMLSLVYYLRSINNISVNNKASISKYLIGTFIYSLAQMIRPGAIATIPLLIVFAGIIFREKSKLFNWKIVCKVLLVSALPFAINYIHFKIIGQEDAMLMSNMAYSLHGFVSGGKRWAHVYVENPLFNDLTISEQNSYLISQTIQNIFQNPQNILYGYLQEFRSLFVFRNQSGFLATINFGYSPFFEIFGWLVIVFLAIGFIRAIINLQSALGGFLLITILGYLISIPFAPGYQSIYLRFYAVSLPFLYLIISYGFDVILQKFSKREIIKEYKVINTTNDGFVIFFLFIIIFTPLLLRIFKSEIPINQSSCPKDMKSSVVFYNPNSTLSVLEDSEYELLNWVPITYQYKFRNEIHNICCKNEIAFFRNLQAPFSVFIYSNPNCGLSYMITDPNLLPEKAGWIQLCGKTTDMLGNEAGCGVFFPEEIIFLQD